MSQEGIKIFANVLSIMQEERYRLLSLSFKDSTHKSAHQDILLGQLLEKAKEFVKDEFCKKHRQYYKFCPYLKDRPTQPWTEFSITNMKSKFKLTKKGNKGLNTKTKKNKQNKDSNKENDNDKEESGNNKEKTEKTENKEEDKEEEEDTDNKKK